MKELEFSFYPNLKGSRKQRLFELKLFKSMDKNPLKPDDMWKGASPQIFLNAKRLRENSTEAEEKLWLAVKDNQIEGYKFRRQHPLSIYVADFYCHVLNLVIEIDGDYHLDPEQKLLDSKRTSDI